MEGRVIEARVTATPEVLVTVVTPAYNAARLLPDAIRSVLRQTVRDFEYIIVNDGSTDDTLEVARGWAAQEQRITLVDRPRRGGVGASRNAGVRLARGRFIAFLDADDVWDSEFLKAQLEQLQAAECEALAVFCHSVNVDYATGRLVGLHGPVACRYDAARMFLARCAPGNGSSLLIRRSMFERIGLFDETLPRGEDVDMWLRCLTSIPNGFFICSPRVLLYRRLHAGSRTTGHNFMLDEQVDVYAARLARFVGRIDPRFHARMYLTYIITVLVVRTESAHQQSRAWAHAASKLQTITFWECLQVKGLPPLLRSIGPELYAVYRWHRLWAARWRMRAFRVRHL